MNAIISKVIIGLIVGCGIYAAGVVWFGAQELTNALRDFSGVRLGAVFFLSLVNYGFRYLRWSFYLKKLAIDVPWGKSLAVFFAGMSMSMTPGKIGELLKSYLLRQSVHVAMVRTIPIVLAERITDLGALLGLLALAALFSAQLNHYYLLTGSILLLCCACLVMSKRIFSRWIGLVMRLPGLARFSAEAEQIRASITALFSGQNVLIAMGLALMAWGAECVGAWIVTDGFPSRIAHRTSSKYSFVGRAVNATFIYAASTVGGLPSPGGLGLTEGGMTALLHYRAGLNAEYAAAATLLIRAATLWFAVILGLGALMSFRREIGPHARPGGRGDHSVLR